MTTLNEIQRNQWDRLNKLKSYTRHVRRYIHIASTQTDKHDECLQSDYFVRFSIECPNNSHGDRTRKHGRPLNSNCTRGIALGALENANSTVEKKSAFFDMNEFDLFEILWKQPKTTKR